MGRARLVSVIINNHNYGRFLREAIDSALNQTYRNFEVIVVDDGSTDDSRSIIADYGSRIVPVVKENGGQGSALNAGFAVSHGEIIVILDADDFLLPSAIVKSVRPFGQCNVAKVHWQMWEVDGDGRKSGAVIPIARPAEGDFRDTVLREGPCSHQCGTGNAYARWFLEKVLPIPESVFTMGADTYLFELAALFGEVRKVSAPQSCYRIHGSNHHTGLDFSERVALEVSWYDEICDAIGRYCTQMSVAVDPELLRSKSWFHRLRLAVQDLAALVPEDAAIALVDEEKWQAGERLAGRRRLPFPERGGVYWGPPRNDATAIREIKRSQRSGAGFIVFAWPAFWWLEYYSEFHSYLRKRFRCVLENDNLLAFSLRS